MAHIKQSMCWWCFARTLKPEQIIKGAKAIGFAGVELVPKDLWPMIADSGLRIVSTGGHGTFSDGLNRRENHARIEDEIKKNIEEAARFNIPNLICFSGNRKGQNDDEGAEITAECLRRVAPLAEQKKVTLVIELLNSKVDHPDYQGDHTSWGALVCQKVGSPAVKLLYDVYHMQIMEGDVIRTIQQNIQYFGHFHIAGNPGRSNIDDTQELNYRGIAQAIAATNYDGFVGHEYVPKGDALEIARQTFKMCDM